jgi:hypothetical protein
VGVAVSPTYTATTNGTSPAWLASIASPTRRIEGRMGATQPEALSNLRVALQRAVHADEVRTAETRAMLDALGAA